MPKKLTTQEFVTRAKLVHGDKFGYDKVEYKTAWGKIIITCQTHGDFLQAPANHLEGWGCLQCRIERTAKANSMSQEEFIIKSQDAHGNRYDYSKAQYGGCLDPVEIICQKHGSFFQIPNTHITNHGCPKCGRESTGLSGRSSTKEFIKKAKQIHGDLYDYSLVDYKTSHTKIRIICQAHGIFIQKPNAHLNGNGCPICKASKGELKVRDTLTSMGIDFETQKKFPHCKAKRRLRFDFYFRIDNKQFLIEFDGSQHIYGWGNKKKNTIERIQHNDSIKTQFAQANGFHLIRIPYTEFDNIESILKSEIERLTQWIRNLSKK